MFRSERLSHACTAHMQLAGFTDCMQWHAKDIISENRAPFRQKIEGTSKANLREKLTDAKANAKFTKNGIKTHD